MNWFLLLLLPFGVLGYEDFPYVVVGDGFVEKRDGKSATVASFQIKFESPRQKSFEKFLMEHCGSGIRPKREVGMIVAVAVAGSVAVVSTGLALFSLWQNSELSDELQRFKDHANVTQQNLELLFNQTSQLFEHIKQIREDQIQEDFFGVTKMERMLDFLKINKKDVLKTLGVDSRLRNEAFRTLQHRFLCEKEPGVFKLEVSHNWNPSRKYGKVVKVGRIGSLTNDGILFRYIDVSKWAVLTPVGPVSASYCHLVGNIYECEEDQGSCTLTKRKTCPIKSEVTTNGTFMEDIWDETFVATVEKFYDVFTGSGSERREVPADKHFLLKMPPSWTAQVGSIRVQGRHKEFGVFHVDVEDALPHANFADVKKIKEGLQKGRKILSSENEGKLHGTISLFSLDSLIHHLPYFLLAFLVLILIVVLMGLFIYCKTFFGSFCGFCRGNSQWFRSSSSAPHPDNIQLSMMPASANHPGKN